MYRAIVTITGIERTLLSGSNKRRALAHVSFYLAAMRRAGINTSHWKLRVERAHRARIVEVML